MSLQAIKFDEENSSLQVLDQLLLPYRTQYIDINSIEDAYRVIKQMQVRGAPAIAIVGAFAIVVELARGAARTPEELAAAIDHLVLSRPTAVNLANACNDIKRLGADAGAVRRYAIALYKDDLRNNLRIGANGLRYIREALALDGFEGPFLIVTVCNTGSLATLGHGTALGIIRTVHAELRDERFWLDQVYPCETRPYNQGAKLTTYELAYEKIPFTLVCDNMVTSLVDRLNGNRAVKDSTAPVKFIIVGADRIVRNGDAANKIGTFQLAALAHFFNQRWPQQRIRFLVAAPRTTVDLHTATGDDIVIEERPARELTTLNAPVLEADGSVGDKVTVGIATPGIEVWNPAFDVTPHAYIDAIVTEDDAVMKTDGEFDLN